METAMALSGIRVLEVADESGAFCGKLLADMGADVIKIEPPGGDRARRIGPFHSTQPDPDRSLFFWFYNTGKRSVVLDLEAERDRFERLLDGADVLLFAGAPSRLDALLERRNGREPIVAAITPFGLDGPRRDWRSCDTVAQALGGMLHVNGHADEPPLRSFGAQAYHSASLHAAIGVVLALLARRRDGFAQRVDVSLQESVVAMVEHVGSSFHGRGRVESRRGPLHWAGGFKIAPARDGWVTVSSVGDWTALLEWVKADGGAGDLVDPVWRDLEYRLAHAEHLFAVLDPWVSGHTVRELIEGARLRKLPFAPVLSVAELASHPQLRARGFFVPLAHPELGTTLTYPGPPYRFSRTPWRLRRRAPLAGEHTAEVLGSFSGASDPPFERGGSGGILRRSHSNESPQRGKERLPRRVLEGVRVLDFTWVVAGPAATRILADHGADVIKVERPDASAIGERRDGLTGGLNRGKRSIVVDLARPGGVAVVRDLVRRSDVVIDNFSRRVLPNWGLDEDALRALRPDLITVRMSAFGDGGPLRDDVAYGPTLQALAGHTERMRHPGGRPAGWGFSFSDMASGAFAALAVVLALWHRARTGAGQRIDLSQLEALASLDGPGLLAAANGIDPGAAPGNSSPERPAAPHGVYRCRNRAGRDRWCAICVFDDDEWSRLVAALGDPAWARRPALAAAGGRDGRCEEIDARIASWAATRDAEEVMEILQAAGVTAGLVADAEDLCEHDPHLRARRYWTRVGTPEGGAVILDRALPRLSRTPGRIAAPGPLAGEHTDEILRDVLGFDGERVAALREEGVVH